MNVYCPVYQPTKTQLFEKIKHIILKKWNKYQKFMLCHQKVNMFQVYTCDVQYLFTFLLISLLKCLFKVVYTVYTCRCIMATPTMKTTRPTTNARPMTTAIDSSVIRAASDLSQYLCIGILKILFSSKQQRIISGTQTRVSIKGLISFQNCCHEVTLKCSVSTKL